MNKIEFLKKHRQAIIALSGAIEQQEYLEARSLTARLEKCQAIYDGFITLMVSDTQGKLLGIYPELDANGRLTIQVNPSISDREYFKQAVATRPAQIP